jgi:XTP/dITP diphosphohydrolase
MIRYVLATGNPDKAREIAEILGKEVELLPRPPSVPEVDETGETLLDNARLKAHALANATGLPAIADDTGLEVDDLGGDPGVRSARFAGEGATYTQNVAKLLAELATRTGRRSARFRTVAIAAWPGGGEIVADGRVDGVIANSPRGTSGFGYDPVFIPDEGDGRTFAEMSAAEKNSISHRGRAFASLARLLPADGKAPPEPPGVVADRRRDARRAGRGGLFAEFAYVVAVWAAGAAFFFRYQWRSGFDKMMGNAGDTRLDVYLVEHWFRVLHGQASWLNPPFFYPHKGLLGWSDTYLLYEIFYAPLRLIGCNPFVALQGSIICTSLLGFASLVALSRFAFGASRWVSLGLGAVFAFSNVTYVHSGEFQFYGVMFVPLVALGGFAAWRAAGASRRARAATVGGLTGLLAAMLLYSTYYVAYFSLLGAGTFVLLRIIASPRSFPNHVWRGLRGRVCMAGPATAGLVAGLIPFAVTYLPSRGISGVTYKEVIRYYAARPRDLLNLGRGNAFWSSTLDRAIPTLVRTSGERAYAVTPLVLVFAVVAGVVCWVSAVRGRSRSANASMCASLAATAAILLVIPLKTSFAIPWAVIYHFPGASSIRGIDRIGIVAQLAAVLALCAAAGELASGVHWRGWVLRGAAGAAVLLIILEQVNTGDVSELDVPAQQALLRSVPAPPAACRSFYTYDPDISHLAINADFQLDAMLISEHIGLPTANGYTAYDPKGWFGAPTASTPYLSRVAAYADAEGIANGLCQLDVDAMTWSGPGALAQPGGRT